MVVYRIIKQLASVQNCSGAVELPKTSLSLLNNVRSATHNLGRQLFSIFLMDIFGSTGPGIGRFLCCFKQCNDCRMIFDGINLTNRFEKEIHAGHSLCSQLLLAEHGGYEAGHVLMLGKVDGGLHTLISTFGNI